jgi:hypothetical protein
MSETSVDVRLQRLLGGEPLAPLRKRLRERFRRAPLAQAVTHIRINALSAEEHTALASLLGRPQRSASSLMIDVGRIDAALQRAGVAASLKDALEIRPDADATGLYADGLRHPSHPRPGLSRLPQAGGA